MQAVVWEGKPFHVSVKHIPKPTIKHPGDAIIQITTAAVCGSDLHLFHAKLGSPNPPWTVGHEAIGIVTEVGDTVLNIKVGDWVIVPDVPDNGHLELGPPPITSDTLYGFGQAFGGDLGGLQAQFARVPFADKSLIVVPAKLAKEQPLDLVLLSDIWPTAWTCLDFAGFQPGDSVAVFGAGPLGLLCAYSAILRGASKVYSIDSVPARLEKARSIGSVPINFTKGDPVKQILKFEPDGVTRTCDCVGFECVNDNLKPDEGIVIQRAVELTTSGGGIGVIGVYLAQDKSKGAPDAQGKRAANIKFPISDFWSKNLRMNGGIVLGSVMAPTLLRLIESGKAKPSFIFTAEYKIEEAQKAYTRFSEHKEIKVSFKFPYSEAIEEENNGIAKEDYTDHRTKRRRV